MQEKIDKKGNAGTGGENLAAQYLERREFRIVERNYRAKCGEVDIIARNKGVLYFFEVKARGPGSLIDPIEAVTPQKMRRVRRAAEHYLMKHPRLERVPCSFGVIGINFANVPPTVECILDAFD